LTVDGLSITDLTPLSGLKTGLLNSTIKLQNTSLASLAGLSGLTSVHWFEINFNSALTSIADLSALTAVSGPLFIQGNAALSNVNGLEGLTIYGNNALTNVDGFSAVTTIGSTSLLGIISNNSLTNIDGLAALVSVDTKVEIRSNFALSACDSLQVLLDQVDDALPGPGPGLDGIPDVSAIQDTHRF